jgi:hypothetical protein
MTAPIEVTTRYATSVPDLPTAWAFVMARIDAVGPAPSVRISPVWVISDDPDDHGFHFTVVVDGMVEEADA